MCVQKQDSKVLTPFGNKKCTDFSFFFFFFFAFLQHYVVAKKEASLRKKSQSYLVNGLLVNQTKMAISVHFLFPDGGSSRYTFMHDAEGECFSLRD